MVHGGEFRHPTTLMRGAIEFVEEYKMANVTELGQVKEAFGGF